MNESGSVFAVRQAIGPRARGPALICPVPFSPRYDLDRDRGIIARIDHPLRGQSVAGRILVCPAVQGGVAGGWTFMKLNALGVGFAGLVFGRVNPVMVQGAVAAGIPIAAGVDETIFGLVDDGAEIELDPAGRRVWVFE